MKLTGFLAAVAAITISIFATGCATSGRAVQARSNPAHAVDFSDSIGLAGRSLPSTELDELKRSVTAELSRRGVTLRPPAQSDYVLSFWVEENAIISSPMIVSMHRDPAFGYYGYGYGADYQPGGRMPRTPVRVEPAPYPTKGIRMKLFVRQPTGTNKFETAWEGYIDGGPRLSPKHYDPLVKTLLGYFGKSYLGKVKPVE